MTDTLEALSGFTEQMKKEMVQWRRHLHANPELSFHEDKTSLFVYETLQSFGSLEITRPTKTSVMARLIGSCPGKTLAIRADMDALPIQEESSYDFISKNPGVMHACGHDGHTAILLTTAKILSGLKEQINGEIRFIFQHAEEVPPGGAIQMVEAGVMDGVDMVIGLHLVSTMEVGNLAINSGTLHPALGNFDIKIMGKGGHGASPHETIDSLTIAAQVVTNLQQIVSRNIDPFETVALSITKIHGGAFDGNAAYNVIPDTLELGGTVRGFNEELLDSIPALMERIIKGITVAHGAAYQFSYKKGYRPVINDHQIAALVEESLIEAFGAEAVHKAKPIMPGEDFSEYLQKAPGAYFYIGAGNQAKGIVYPHHHPRFAIDEDALAIGVKAFLYAVFKLLG
ncbi:amidohydrolase [Neobacillus mesonae]|uniref:N-acyl-L-amino acid amidohydrolase n=1 Tax=Neobacillus mesonae TaxID=1193713 RepID=A0A3Q9QY69_9BACI|nr:amidohydrolase [Neobacillus mesonae]AZU64998.1 N-acyl-L-amino acid amidohydrolase [Neobacillus mesonae]